MGKAVERAGAEQALAEALAPEGSGKEVGAREELVELARMYLEADRSEKEAKDTKSVLRGPIMELITEVVCEEVPLSRKVARVPREEIDRAFGGDVRAWAALKYPEWDVTGVAVLAEADEYGVSLAESPELTKYEFSVDGHKFGRTVSHGAPVVDVEALRADEQFLALGAEEVIREVTVYELDAKAAATLLLSPPESGVVFSRHTQPGRVTPKLLPFTAMKEDA